MSTLLNKVSVSRLTADEVDEAFGLARLAFPGLTLSRWRTTARRWTARPDGQAGALLARDGAGRLIGLAPFAVRKNLRAGRTLWVERVASFALLDGRPVVEALANGLQELARTLNCRGLEVAIETGDQALREALSTQVHSIESTLFHAAV